MRELLGWSLDERVGSCKHRVMCGAKAIGESVSSASAPLYMRTDYSERVAKSVANLSQKSARSHKAVEQVVGFTLGDN